MTRMVQAIVKLAARTNTGPCGSVELQAIAAVHESLVGTFRTSQPWCVMSAVEVRADEGAGRFDFSFGPISEVCSSPRAASYALVWE